MKNKTLDLNWHTLSIAETIKHLETSAKTGLTNEQINFRQEYYGKNTLPQKSEISLIKIFFRQFKNSLIYVLLLAAIISLIVHEYHDSIIIMAVLLIHAIIGTAQEYKAEQNAANLNKLITIKARVRRNGQVVSVDASELVVGDIVTLTAGNKIPADLRLIETNQLQINESVLTGESKSVVKQIETLDGEPPLGDRLNLAYSGSQVVSGSGIGVVVATGQLTQIGIIAQAIIHEDSLKPPLVIRMERFTKQLALIILGLCSLFLITAILKGFTWDEVLFLAIALAVSAIPEGLPIAITVALSIATKKMVNRQVLVRKLAAVEGLGSCNVIASDKTGTLTVNRQLIRKIYVSSGETYDVSGDGYDDHGAIALERSNTKLNGILPTTLKNLIVAGSIANEADLFYSDELQSWRASGDEVDLAFLSLGYKSGILPELKSQLDIKQVTPYLSERKFSATLVNLDNKECYFIKGAVETILNKCSFQLDESGSCIPLQQKSILAEVNILATQGYRVLAIAGKTGKQPTPIDDNLIFYGLVGMIDPLRVESFTAVQECHAAGIKVIMITGDYPETALAIAKQLGIANTKSQIMTGNQFEQLYLEQDPNFESSIKDIRVFARVSPLQKMYIVETLDSHGNFVAVTGDGVNDVPALKKAHIGISMGSGSDITKDSADLIIIDDNFKSIVSGVEEGRYAYDNIRKVTYLLIASAFAEIFLLLLSVVAGLPLPLTAIQLLWVNLITNGIQDVALAFEGGEKESMQRRPRSSKERIFNRLMIEEALISGLTIGGCCFALWYALLAQGYSEWHSHTLLFMLLILMENFHVFNCRSEYKSVFKIPLKNNYFVVLAVISAQLIQFIVSRIPLMQEFLDTSPINLHEWLYLLVIAAFLLLVMEIYKRFRSSKIVMS